LATDIEDLYRRYGPVVLRRCRTLLRDEEKALDAMHETFEQLLRRPGLQVGSPVSLLWRVATNVCLNKIRTEKRHPETRDEDLLARIAGAPDPEGPTGAARLLERLFAKEQPSTRTLAVLHLLDGMTLEEVAAESGLSVSGVRKRLKLLREHLVELEGV
jgi:RNA polymerase sigma factor (sigma-70 family)